MENIVENYQNAKEALLSYFNCSENYSVKVLNDYRWRIKNNGDIYILAYWKNGGKLNECVITKTNDQPTIYRREQSTMVICIECIKQAVVLNNSLET